MPRESYYIQSDNKYKMRINDKIKELEEYLYNLSEIAPKTFEEYKNARNKFACERLFEVIVEAIVDTAFLVIKEKKLKMPMDDKSAFDILSAERIITGQLAEKLKDAKGMRNVIAHEYGKINDELVFYSLREELEKDVEEFIKAVRKALK